VCAYAVCQHTVSSSAVEQASESVVAHYEQWERWRDGFVRAIEAAEGRVVTILDKRGITYTRAWCMLEVYFARVYDIYTSADDCGAYDMDNFSKIAAAVGKEGLRGSAWLTETYARLPTKRGIPAVGITDGPATRRLIPLGEAWDRPEVSAVLLPNPTRGERVRHLDRWLERNRPAGL